MRPLRDYIPEAVGAGILVGAAVFGLVLLVLELA